jgi:hypothetical protein
LDAYQTDVAQHARKQVQVHQLSLQLYVFRAAAYGLYLLTIEVSIFVFLAVNDHHLISFAKNRLGALSEDSPKHGCVKQPYKDWAVFSGLLPNVLNVVRREWAELNFVTGPARPCSYLRHRVMLTRARSERPNDAVAPGLVAGSHTFFVDKTETKQWLHLA